MNIILIGLKNAGKTSVGSILSKSQKYSFIDTDDLIIKEYNKQYSFPIDDITEVHEKIGEKQFRKIELGEIKKQKDAAKTILSTGGGSIVIEESLTILKNIGKVVYLYLSEEEFVSRCMSNYKKTYLQSENLNEIFHYRNPICQKVSDLVLDATNKSVSEISKDIESCLL